MATRWTENQTYLTGAPSIRRVKGRLSGRESCPPGPPSPLLSGRAAPARKGVEEEAARGCQQQRPTTSSYEYTSLIHSAKTAEPPLWAEHHSRCWVCKVDLYLRGRERKRWLPALGLPRNPHSASGRAYPRAICGSLLPARQLKT